MPVYPAPRRGAAALCAAILMAGMAGLTGPAVAVAAAAPATPVAPSPAPWLADLGNGRYQNPVLHADYSDPDAIRVGDTYYMTASSFSNLPGLPLLRSSDMVNWELAGHALASLAPAAVYAAPQPGKGVWAPCLRFHDGKFWIFYPDPDFGVYVITAQDFSGPWSEPHLLLAGKGIIDPAPLWDDDGQAYLIHGWAMSRSGINNILTLRRMAPDGRSLLDQKGRDVVDGGKLPGYHTLEGPKLYKAHGYYYIFAPAGGVEHGWQSVFRSRSVEGPYENRIVMAQGTSPVNGPHQGAWVEGVDGHDWFLHFQDQGAYGRVMHLQPMTWRDGWPVIGVDKDGSGVGEPVLSHTKPAVGGQTQSRTQTRPRLAPATTDEFNGGALGLQWQWNANPDPAWSALDARAGHLRLYAQGVPAGGTLRNVASVLTQKFPAPAFSVDTKLELSGAEGQRAGLLVLGIRYAWIGVRQRDGQRQLVLASCETAVATVPCVESSTVLRDVGTQPVYLRARVEQGGMLRFSYSLDQVRYTPAGPSFQAGVGRWVGAQIGLFSTASGIGKETFADVDYFRVSR